MRKLFITTLFFIVLLGCKTGKNEPKAVDDTTNIDLSEVHDSLKIKPQPVEIAEVNKDSVLMGMTKEIFTVFKSQQYAKLDSFIHPEEGVRFSPYATVSNDDKKFTKDSFVHLLKTSKNKKLNWGTYDGSGDPILLTPAEYFKKFVYDANFVKPENAAVNKVFEQGNSLNNLKNFYKESDFTESHFSGTKKNGGIDWKSVRLVFKEVNGKYYLVGVVHDQWTI